jgi:hypothetical protein
LIVSPETAAKHRTNNRVDKLSEPLAARVPVAKIRESPGKKGVNTKPVSEKTVANSSKYISNPYSFVIAFKCISRCKKESIKCNIDSMSCF